MHLSMISLSFGSKAKLFLYRLYYTLNYISNLMDGHLLLTTESHRHKAINIPLLFCMAQQFLNCIVLSYAFFA